MIRSNSINDSHDWAEVLSQGFRAKSLLFLSDSAVRNHIDESKSYLLDISMMEHVREDLWGLFEAELTDLLCIFFFLEYELCSFANRIAETGREVDVIVAEDIKKVCEIVEVLGWQLLNIFLCLFSYYYYIFS